MTSCRLRPKTLRSLLVLHLIAISCQPLPQGVVEPSAPTEPPRKEPGINRQADISNASGTPQSEPTPAESNESSQSSSASDETTPSVAASSSADSFRELEGVRVSYQFSEATRLMILKELSNIPLLDLPLMVVPKGIPHGLAAWYIWPLPGLLNLFKKNPLLLVDFDVLSVTEDPKDSASADALGFSLFHFLELQKPLYKHQPKLYNENVLTLGHEFPGDPFVPYKYQLNHLIRIGSFFSQNPKDTPYANAGHLFTVLLHEMQHFQGLEFDHAQLQSGDLVIDGDQVSNGAYSIMVPVLERLIEGCVQQEKLQKAGTPKDRPFKCTSKDKGILLSIHSYCISVSSYMFDLPKGPAIKTEGATIQPL